MRKIIPLGDRVVLLQPKEKEISAGGIILPESGKEKPIEAKVIAVGPDTKPPLKVGCTVVYGKYDGIEIKVDEVEYIVMKGEDVSAILEEVREEKEGEKK